MKTLVHQTGFSYTLKKYSLCLLMMLALTFNGSSQAVFIGPMIHYNIENNTRGHFSYGIEASYWAKEVPLLVPASIDFGIEYGNKKTRIYSEVQGIFFVLGYAAGYVREFTSLTESTGGFQGSGWVALLGGFNLRYRHMGKNKNTLAPGIFVKYPLLYDFPF